jgi:hypothetical protein
MAAFVSLAGQGLPGGPVTMIARHGFCSLTALTRINHIQPIFRVSEYSELSIPTGVRSRSDQEGWVTKLGIFLSANLAAEVEVVDD